MEGTSLNEINNNSKTESIIADSFMVTCENIKQPLAFKYNTTNNNIYMENSLLERQMKCLIKNMNNSTTINEISNIIENIKKINSYLSNNIDFKNDKENGFEKNLITKIILNQKWRGETIFSKILDVGNVFGCYRESGLNCGDYITEQDRLNCYNIVPVHTVFFDAYTSMIRSIDGMTVEKYLEGSYPKTTEYSILLDKDKCQETLYKTYYNAIKEAYAKGLIVLKDYGEE